VSPLLPTRVLPLWNAIMQNYGKWRGNAKMQTHLDFFCSLLMQSKAAAVASSPLSTTYKDCVIKACRESLVGLSCDCTNAERGTLLVKTCMEWMKEEQALAAKRIPARDATDMRAAIYDIVKVNVCPVFCSLSLCLLRNRRDIEMQRIYSIFEDIHDQQSIAFLSDVFSKFVLGEICSFIENCLSDGTMQDGFLFLSGLAAKEKELSSIASNISSGDKLKPLVQSSFKSVLFDKEFCLSHLPPQFNLDSIDKEKAKSVLPFF